MEQADRAVTPDDVVAAYELFLGRRPESRAAVAEKLSHSLETLVAELLGSAEFRLHVLAPLLDGGGADPRLDAPPRPGLWTWTAEALRLDLPDPRRASTWGLLLLEVLAVTQTPAGLLGSTLPDIDHAALRRALNAGRRSVEHAGLCGAIEALDDDGAEGWALDMDAPGRRLVVQLRVNGVVAAAGTPDRFRRDLQDAYGGDGVFGFRLELPPPADADARSGRPARVELVEHTSQRRLASRVLVRDAQPRLDALSRVTTLLEEVKARLLDVETLMPAAQAVAAFSVLSYDAYRQAFGVSSPSELEDQRQRSGSWEFQPRFLVLCGEPGADLPARTLASLQAQSYGRWRRLHDAGPPENGDYIVSFAAGDELEPDAFYRLADAIRADRPLILTVDDDEVEDGEFGRPRYAAPRLRGAHDPWLLLQKIEPDALLAVEAAFALASGVAAGSIEGALRLSLVVAAGPARSRHLPHVLHHRRNSAEVVGAASEDLLEAARRQVLRTGVHAIVEPHADVLGAPAPGAIRIRPHGPQATLASVIIPTRDRLDLIRPCIEGLLATREANATPFEVLVVDNGGEDADTANYLDELSSRGGVRLIHDASAFNWSRLNNRASEQANGEVLLFLNDDTTPVSAAWCDELCLWANWPGAGVVGARLIYGDGTLQHAGVVTGVFGEAAHEGVGRPGSDAGYLGRHALVHRANAVTGACMAVRRTCFEDSGGFDESFAVAYNDIDFCLRVQVHGWAVLYAPQAVFHHFESKTRRFDARLDEAGRAERRREAARLHAAWGRRLTHDPFYNPHFERWAPPFSRLAAHR